MEILAKGNSVTMENMAQGLEEDFMFLSYPKKDYSSVERGHTCEEERSFRPHVWEESIAACLRHLYNCMCEAIVQPHV
jgi:hypothetical protein